jgi:MipA family protein
MTRKTTFILAAVLLQAFALAGAARAEGARPVAFSAMLGAVYAPLYEGSDKSEASGLVDFNVSFGEGRFFAGTRGIGYAPVLTDTVTLSVALGYGGGRDMKDDPTNLAGLGDLDYEALAILSGEYRAGQIGFAADVVAGEDYGVTADLKVTAGFDLSDRISLGSEISATYADTSHMQRYFGVTAVQSAASGKAVYDAGSGFKSTGIGVSASFAVTDRAAIRVGAGYDRLIGDAGRSPITRDKGQASAFLGLSTQF